MTKTITIVLLIACSLLSRPMQAFAGLYDGSEAMSCCEKEPATSMPCCEESDSKETEHNCGGDCECPNCECVGHVSATTLFIFQRNNTLIPSIEKEQNFFFLDTFISSDLRAIWLPPKIS